MFKSPGKTLQGLAEIVFSIGLLGSLGWGVYLTTVSVISGLCVILGGTLSSFVLSALIDGFGRLILVNELQSEQNKAIIRMLSNNQNPTSGLG